MPESDEGAESDETPHAVLPWQSSRSAALAKIRNTELITGDQEFKEIESKIKIGWLE